ncbi:MAG TPA: zinc-dependent metalloprotease, partial [Vicinamibacterales bacterium]|nr:zinc-dependent metalloprotease [Vicinamibacterales bacterium]
AQIRDKNFVHENGHTPSIMDYARFNYVAQPEDGIAVDDLVPKIGPYDKWATHWGYAPIPGVTTPDQEKPTLDKWAREQDEKPYLRFSTEGNDGSDPGDETEAVGDIDAVRATTLGLKNLGRVSEMLFPATSTKVGDPWNELEEVYGRMVSQWQLEMNHVVRVVGGFNSQQKHIGQQGVRFTTVPKARQKEAVQFLVANAFQTPMFMIQPDILRRIQASGVVERVRTAQNSVLNNLLQAARLDRMVEQTALDGSVAYPPIQFLGDLRKGVWAELATPATPIGIYRRNLHRSYLDTVDTRLNGNTPPSDEVRALLRGELRALDGAIQKALPLVTDEVSRRHLVDARDQIAQTLDPRAMRTRAPDPAAAGRGGRGGLR